jgi:hypothetical protein
MLSALVPLLWAENASADFECRFDPSTRVLSVAKAGGGGEEEVVIRRVGTSIRVARLFGPDVPCEGAPTVTTTDLIEISSSGISAVAIELEHGPFAPGATPEADASSEIEFTVAGSGIAAVEGRSGADHLRYMTAGGVSGLNLNPGPSDNDVDIELPPLRSKGLFIADGAGGKDLIDVVGRPNVLVAAGGGAGDDTLLAQGAIGAILDGGTGADRIVGSPGFDLISPGNGVDRVTASGGGDLVGAKPDGSRDRIDCGSGRDEISRTDRIDRLRSCERVMLKG